MHQSASLNSPHVISISTVIPDVKLLVCVAAILRGLVTEILGIFKKPATEAEIDLTCLGENSSKYNLITRVYPGNSWNTFSSLEVLI